MKKYLLTTALCLSAFLSLAQTDASQYFEGGKMEDSFLNLTNTHRSQSIVGKMLGYIDYYQGISKAGNTMSVGEGISYALTLIKAPALFHMVKDRPNVLITSSGYIVLRWTKNTWNISYEKSVPSEKDVRVYVLTDR